MEMLGRRALWEVGLNYGHGTGHGVGNYFGVHECMFSYYFHTLSKFQCEKRIMINMFNVVTSSIDKNQLNG